jgi:uncharacterized protein (TIGR02757 family)
VQKLSPGDLKNFLDEKVLLYNRSEFINDDPVSIPHRFSKNTDIEIAGFLSATIAWGQRVVILKNALLLLSWMDNDPHSFIINFTKNDLKQFEKFVHRTFNGTDCIYFLKSLKKIYTQNNSLQAMFVQGHNPENADFLHTISAWRKKFFSLHHLSRTEKHFANPEAGSAAKRINMFLRWMIRKDKSGVDFGIWKFNTALLTCPLDVHSARVARKLGLLNRKQNDWQAAAMLTTALRKLDPDDPVKYDFALFGLGVNENF